MTIDYNRLEPIQQSDEPLHFVATDAHCDDIKFGVASSLVSPRSRRKPLIYRWLASFLSDFE